jgi:hypothetical protein
MEKSRTLSDLFVQHIGCTNTSPHIIEPARKYCATVGYNVVTWKEVSCLTSYTRQSTQSSNFTHKIPISFFFLGGGLYIIQLYVPEERKVKQSQYFAGK